MKIKKILSLRLLNAICLLLIMLFVPSLAQSLERYVTQGKNDPVKITYLQNGVLKLKSRKAQTTVNVKNDLPGCLRPYDGSEPKFNPSKTDLISIRVLDEVVKGDKFFLLLQINTGGNCNIQGYCGAVEENGLYWWQFNSALKQENYHHALIDSCMQFVGIDEWNGKIKDDQGLALETNHGKLVIKYTKYEYGQNGDEKSKKSYSLIYNRETPEQGLVISEIK